jgi:predicted lipid-binding transport protein (Tim44 family)
MFDSRWTKMLLVFFTLYFLTVFVLPEEAFARVGGGLSSGSRGSRTYTAPRSTPLPTRSSQVAQPSSGSTAQPMSQPAAGGFWRSLAGGVAGGLIGGMLFRSLGFAGDGFGGGGIGFMDIILIGGILYLIYRFIRKRKKAADSIGNYRSGAMDMGSADPSSSSSFQAGPADDMDQGFGHIRQMDPSFDEQKFKDLCMDIFFRIQGAWAGRDMSSVSNILTGEMYGILQGEAEKMKAERKINKLDNIAVRSVNITEVWQESGQDYITVKFFANLLDSTVDETTGQVLSGSKTDPIKFEEYWTFTRPVGAGTWQLSAINQAE